MDDDKSTGVKGRESNVSIMIYPQPTLTDIEFDTEGNMILGFADRSGFQWGSYNYGTDTGSDQLYDSMLGGDILRVKRESDGSYTPEYPRYVGPYTDDSTEFFTGEEYAPSVRGGHYETSQGGLAVLAGSDEVVLTAMDPTGWNKGGFLWLSTQNGSKKREVDLFYGHLEEGLYGKSTSMGDVELLTDPAPVEIGNRVWFDRDADGVQDPGEAGIAGVTVQLLDAGGNVIAEVQTDSDGEYIFSNDPSKSDSTGRKYNITALIADNNYTVRIPEVTGSKKQSALSSYILTQANTGAGSDPNLNDSDGLLNTTHADAAVLASDLPLSGANNHSFDFGFTAPVSLGSLVWYDSNNNGIQDDGEEGIEGVSVSLLDARGNPVLDGNGDPIRTTTDENGTYYFGDLREGNYTVELNLSSLAEPYFPATPQNPDVNDNNPEDSNILYSDDLNRIYRSGVVELTVGAEPEGSDETSARPNSGDDRDDDDDASGNMTVDFGFVTRDFGDAPDSYGTTLANNGPSHVIVDGLNLGFLGVESDPDGVPSVGADEDDKEMSISDVIIPVVDSSGNLSYAMTNNIWHKNDTGTDAYFVAYIDFNGDGDFDDEGERSETITVPDSWAPIVPTFNNIRQINVGTTYARLRFSTDRAAVESPTGPAPDGEVEDYTVQIVPAVRLKKEIPSNTSDTFDLNITNEKDEQLDFEDAQDGDATGYIAVVNNDAGNDIAEINVTESYNGTETYLSDLVCTDANGKVIYSLDPAAVLDASNPTHTEIISFEINDTSLNANTITCSYVNTLKEKSVVTKSVSINDGTDFNYTVRINGGSPTAFLLDGDLNASSGDNDGIYYAYNGIDITQDSEVNITEYAKEGWAIGGVNCAIEGNALSADEMGISGVSFPLIGEDLSVVFDIDAADNFTCNFQNVKLSSLGSLVWIDSDKDGTQESGEPGVEGALVTLLDNDGKAILDQNGDPVTTRTDADGLYYFNDLIPGTYRVSVTFDSATQTPTGVTDIHAVLPTPVQNSNANDDNNSDSNVDTGTIDANQSDQTWYSAPIVLDGNESTGEKQADGSDDQPGQSGRDDDSGNMTLDLGFFEPRVSIGSLVWEDSNDNGVQDPDEKGIEGVTVVLLDEDNNTLASTTTDENGSYYFGDLPEGAYRVEVNMSSHPYHIPSSVQNDSDDDDSDDDSNIAYRDDANRIYRSGLFTLSNDGEPEGEDSPIAGSGDEADSADDNNGNMTVDFGFYLPRMSIGSVVWADINDNGVQEADEQGIANAVVTLLDAQGNPVQNDVDGNAISPVTTGANGSYYFGNLPEGEYYVQVDMSNNPQYLPSDIQNAQDDNDTDNDSNIASGDDANHLYRSGRFTLSYGQEPTLESSPLPDSGETADAADDANGNMTVDFGFYIPSVSIGSLVWEDRNQNGLQDVGEAPLEGALLTLLDEQGNEVTQDVYGRPIEEINTSETGGTYYFGYLPEGKYTIKVTPPAGYTGKADPASSDDQNAEDNNLKTEQNGAYLSPLIELTLGGEPTGSDEESYVNGAGDDQDDRWDSNGDMTVDFGFYKPSVSIGSVVWYDENNNRLQDANESFLENAIVTLLDASGNEVTEDVYGEGISEINTYDTGGTYYFGNLPAGDYIVKVTPPAGYVGDADPASADDQNPDDNNLKIAQSDGSYLSPVISLQVGDEPTGADENSTLPFSGDDQDDPTDANGDMTVDFGFHDPVPSDRWSGVIVTITVSKMTVRAGLPERPSHCSMVMEMK